MNSKRMNSAKFLAIFLGCVSPVLAGSPRIDISVTPQKESGEKKRQNSVMVEEILYQYTVKLTNKSFAPATGLSAQYRIFVRDDSGKGAVSQQKLKRQESTAKIPDLSYPGTYSFETEAVKLQKATLDSDHYWVSGNRNRSQDKVAGVWIRVLQGDTVVGEYLNPSTLAAKEKF